MDDLQLELPVPEADFDDDTSENERNPTTMKPTSLLHVSPVKGT